MADELDLLYAEESFLQTYAAPASSKPADKQDEDVSMVQAVTTSVAADFAAQAEKAAAAKK